MAHCLSDYQAWVLYYGVNRWNATHSRDIAKYMESREISLAVKEHTSKNWRASNELFLLK